MASESDIPHTEELRPFWDPHWIPPWQWEFDTVNMLPHERVNLNLSLEEMKTLVYWLCDEAEELRENEEDDFKEFVAVYDKITEVYYKAVEEAEQKLRKLA